MNADYEIDKRLGLFMAQKQDHAPISLEETAATLGCSANTLRNWMRGKSGPTPAEYIAYCNIIGVDGIAVFADAVYQNDAERAHRAHSAELHALIDALAPEDQERLLYALKTHHGSDPKAMLQQMDAQSHLPMMDRVLAAQSVETSYRIAERQGTLVNPETAPPDMAYLHGAIEQGFQAAAEGLNAYVGEKKYW